MLRIIALSLSALLTFGFAAESFGAGRSTYVVAAAQDRYFVDLNKVECVSIVPKGAIVLGTNTFDDPQIIKILHAVWPSKQIYQDNGQCPYVLVFNILSMTHKAVTYKGEPSVVSMAFQVCARKPDASIDTHLCSYKSLYLFRRDVTPIGAFEIGIKAFVQSQSQEWVIINVDLE